MQAPENDMLIISRKTYVFCFIAVIVVVLLGFFSYKWYFNYKYSLKAKLIATVTADKLIDKSLVEIVKKDKNGWIYFTRNSDKLRAVFKDIDFSLFPPDTTILIVNGELSPDMNYEKFDSSDLTPRGDQRYVGVRLADTPQTQNIFYLYTYNGKCMLVP